MKFSAGPDEDLDVGLEIAAGSLDELSVDRWETRRPDRSGSLRDRATLVVALFQLQIDVPALCLLDLADLGAHPDGFRQTDVDHLPDRAEKGGKRHPLR